MHPGICNIALHFLTGLGAYAAIIFLFDCLKSPFNIFWNTIFSNSKPFKTRYGPWAVITGSSDGIGKQYAFNLASKGMNVFLISRTESKLIKIAEEIQSKHAVDVKWLSIDFSKSQQIYEDISEALSGLDIGMLVNNVGTTHQYPLEFDRVLRNELQQIISVNIETALMMTHMVLPGMKRRRRGIIINMSSAAGLSPMPHVSVYAASKAFINHFTLALKEELRGTGVECQLVYPLFIVTNLTGHLLTVNWWAFLATGVKKFTKFAVFTIGKTDCTTGFWRHGLQLTILKICNPLMSLKIFSFAVQSLGGKSHGQ
ncbi:inactive hydroxysteroid dehydrogenase-like protein 1 [Malaya genurostris]|uniref:inactive hydroxysteroid dehydrogenase-like protein 1 n=1 Tax=Malaya genurostris TaxID=325434 RepID=UPI0026F40293|nr:inactive hydroxysteroid dehydrogenase-like protein 1 [Malaya genurostris]